MFISWDLTRRYFGNVTTHLKMTTRLVPATNGENNQETLRFNVSLRKLFEFVLRHNLWFSGAASTCKVSPRFAEFANA